MVNNQKHTKNLSVIAIRANFLDTPWLWCKTLACSNFFDMGMCVVYFKSWCL